MDILGFSQIIQYAANDNKIDEMKETEYAETNSEKENLNINQPRITQIAYIIQPFMILPRFY